MPHSPPSDRCDQLIFRGNIEEKIGISSSDLKKWTSSLEFNEIPDEVSNVADLIRNPYIFHGSEQWALYSEMITLSITGVWWLYGMKARDGTGFVMMRLAFLPTVIEPRISLTPIAYAELIVQALRDCSGVRRILMHPRAITKRIFPLGLEPGL
jgi:hypothetical protein